MKSHLSILAIVVFMMLFGILTYQGINQINENNYWVNHTGEVIAQTEKVQASLFESDALFMRYIVSKDLKFKIEYENENNIILNEIDKLKKMTQDNEFQQKACENLLNSYKKRTTFKETIINADDAKLVARPENNQLKCNIIFVINSINEEEQKLLKERMRSYSHATTAFSFITGFGIIILAGLCFWAGNHYSTVCRRNDLESFLNKIKS